MITTLENTTTPDISSAIVRARRAAGSPAMGMVLTLVICLNVDEDVDEAIEAATQAAKEHPCRILVAVSLGGRRTELDAEVRIGGGTPGELVLLHMKGQMGRHAASVVRPLLLPDSPVVVWWPGTAPADLAGHELGQMADRRVTDSMGAARPLRALRLRSENYQPGDTDLAWTRITLWRSLLAAALDQYSAKVQTATVAAERNSASANLLAAWLSSRLRVPVTREVTDGPGITSARMTTAAGDISITRGDGKLASYTVPGQPNRLVALKRRPVAELLAEELRRMDPDDIFHQTVTALLNQPRNTGITDAVTTQAPGRRATAKKATAKKTTTKQAPATKTAAKKATAKKTAAKKTAN
ncbi:glucose-6-phosphate dehydrogenase assembly protein OpcA [Propionibacteriaceae bacterium Y2011]